MWLLIWRCQTHSGVGQGHSSSVKNPLERNSPKRTAQGRPTYPKASAILNSHHEHKRTQTSRQTTPKPPNTSSFRVTRPSLEGLGGVPCLVPSVRSRFAGTAPMVERMEAPETRWTIPNWARTDVFGLQVGHNPRHNPPN